MTANLASALLLGMTSGAGIGAIALPFVLVARATGVFNFAYATTTVVAGIGAGVMLERPGISWLLAASVWTLAGGAAGAITYVVGVRSVDKTTASGGSHLTLVTTLAIGLIMETLAFAAWGESPMQISPPVTGGWHVFADVFVPYYQLLLLFAVVAVGVGTDAWIHRSSAGLIWRAMGEDRVLAESRGVNFFAQSLSIFGAGGALAALAGIGVAGTTAFTPFIGLSLALDAFLVLGLVGVDSIAGAIGGGLVLGVVERLLQLAVGSAVRDVMIIVLIVFVLCLKPAGLFGRRKLREA